MYQTHQRRYEHSLSVAETAERMALAYGVNPFEARVAGVLHDWDKVLSTHEQIDKAQRLGIDLGVDYQLVAGLLQQDTDYPVIVMPAGMYVELRTTCTPEDASSRAVVYTTTDAGIAKVTGRALKAMQRGECELTVASAQDPQVSETFHILVTQPVKRVAVSGPEKKVAAGSQLQLTAECSPENASIREVTWSSKTPNVATVDESGMVTGIKKGTATITATATDGSKKKVTCKVTVK
jgi:putative nucleotidyltransferase with HDIG domain